MLKKFRLSAPSPLIDAPLEPHFPALSAANHPSTADPKRGALLAALEKCNRKTSGSISLDEWVSFVKSNAAEHVFDPEQVKAVFESYDSDKDGTAPITQFVDNYLGDVKYSREQVENCKKMISEALSQKQEFEFKLKEAKVKFFCRAIFTKNKTK